MLMSVPRIVPDRRTLPAVAGTRGSRPGASGKHGHVGTAVNGAPSANGSTVQRPRSAEIGLRPRAHNPLGEAMPIKIAVGQRQLQAVTPPDSFGTLRVTR